MGCSQRQNVPLLLLLQLMAALMMLPEGQYAGHHYQSEYSRLRILVSRGHAIYS